MLELELRNFLHPLLAYKSGSTDTTREDISGGDRILQEGLVPIGFGGTPLSTLPLWENRFRVPPSSRPGLVHGESRAAVPFGFRRVRTLLTCGDGLDRAEGDWSFDSPLLENYWELLRHQVSRH